MASTDRLNFSQEKIFKKVCENLQKSDGKTKNLIDCKNDILFVWDAKEKRLLTQIIKVLNKDASVYQELHPTEPPLIDIHFVRVNSSLTKAALWGPSGVMVMNIPRRWGSHSGFQGGKPVILTRCSAIDMRYFLLHDIEVRQVRFHPGSAQDNCLVVLTSDNTFRVYTLPGDSINEEPKEHELIHVWPLSQNPIEGKGWNLRGSKIPFLASLGDVAVDFDFGLSFMGDDYINNKDEEIGFESVIWPAVILRGNGDVCILKTSLLSNQRPKFEGPLTMYPPADDNYGVEACSILVLPTTPNIIVVATSSGTLYHSILLKIDGNGKPGVVTNTTHGLYVIECVELELGIQLNDEDPSYSCPVILHNDPVCRWKYYCTHNTGLHAVSASFVWQLEKFVEQPSGDNLRLDQPSTVEYLICTRTNTTPVLPVLGFTILPSSNVILALLANGDLVSLPLKVTEVFMHTGIISEEIVGEEATPIKKLLQQPFDVHIRNLLKRNINQPLIKLDKNVNLSPQESLDLISRTTNILRQEYFTKFQLVRDEIEQRVMTLRTWEALHLDELKQLENEKASLQSMAEKLGEKYEEIKDKQQMLNVRIEKVVSAVLELQPIESLAEKKMKNELIAVEENIEAFEKSISRLKKEMDYQKYKKSEHRLEKQKSIKLGGNQVEAIKTSLNKTSQEISELVKAVNLMKKQLNIVDGYEMCILFIKLIKATIPGKFKLILASNRDELFKRPGRSAHFWEEDTNIFGGRDLTENKEGGTWLAMSKRGKLGVLLNVAGENPNPEKLGRGFLIAEFLKSSLTDKEYSEKIMNSGHEYNKFHLITGFMDKPQPSLYYCTNSNNETSLQEIQTEVFAIGNSLLEKPFQKVTKGKKKFEEICNNYGKVERKQELLHNLLTFLKWEEKHYPDEVIDSLTNLPSTLKPSYSAVFVKAPDLLYGTRTHTIILIDWKDNVEFHEWTLEEPINPQNMKWRETHENFTINLDSTA